MVKKEGLKIVFDAVRAEMHRKYSAGYSAEWWAVKKLEAW